MPKSQLKPYQQRPSPARGGRYVRDKSGRPVPADAAANAAPKAGDKAPVKEG